MAQPVDRRAARLAARQLGLVAREQALRIGVPAYVIQARLRALRWEELHRGVYRVAGVPPGPEQEIFAAVLAAGPHAAASHRSAAVLWALRGVSRVQPEVTVPYERYPVVEGIRVYRSRTFGREAVTRLGPIPITTPVRTLLDLGSVLGAEALEDALDDALQRRLVTPAKLEAAMGGNRRGVRGVAKLRDLLVVRAGGHLGESSFENRLRRLLISSGLPAPVAQHVVRDEEGRFVARVDLAYPDVRLAIEGDGYAFHSGRGAFERDRARQNALINAGWRVLRVTPTQLDRDASAVVRMVTDAMGASVKRRRV